MTSLRAVPPSPELARLLAEYAGRGGVLHFAPFDAAALLPGAELHRSAALATVEDLAADNEAYFAQPETVKVFRDMGSDPEDHFRIVTDPERAAGRPVTVEEFVGPYFHWPSRRLFLRGRTSDYLNEYFLPGEEENAANARRNLRLGGSGPFITQGYADAFADPPYTFQGGAVEVNALFAALNAELFDGLSGDLVIYEWSTDWSNYFDSGQEWWGAFLWTVHNKKAGLIVGVAASTTD